MFIEYQSKPSIRKAFQIVNDMTIKEVGPKEYYINGIRVHCAEHPEYGGWVVKIDKDDIYYCSDKIFRERNIV